MDSATLNLKWCGDITEIPTDEGKLFLAMRGVPHTVTCAILGVSLSWLYKWLHREPTDRERRRAEVSFEQVGELRRLLVLAGQSLGPLRFATLQTLPAHGLGYPPKAWRHAL
ncbi:hypothetical protein MAHJHV63_55450 [Mycobacterium avium subsp. hominissuis]